MSIALNPTATPTEKSTLKLQLQTWASMDICPLEDPDLKLRPGHFSRRSHHHHHSHNRTRSTDGTASRRGDEQARQQQQQQQQQPADPALGSRNVSSGRSHRSHRHRPHSSRPRTVLHKGMDALRMDWADNRLRTILTHDSPPTSIADGIVSEGDFFWNGKNSI